MDTDAASAGAEHQEGSVASVELPDGRRLTVREARPDDADGLTALYRRLSVEDLLMRFFTAAAPAPSFVGQWLTLAERGGLLLVAVLDDAGGSRTLVAEAGYSPLDDGDAELGIAVDPAWRGWLGPWLLALLLDEAAARGIPNLEAVVKLGNRRMIALLHHRGSAIVERDSPDEIRLVVGTSGPTPTWPAGHGKPRVLVAAASGQWKGEDAAREAGFEIRTCRGPASNGRCPVADGGSCPLADGADAVVMLLPPSDPRTARLLAAHELHPGLQIIVPEHGCAGPDNDKTPEQVVESLRLALGAS